MRKECWDLENEQDVRVWLDELREMLKVPTPYPEVALIYRDRMKEWELLETWEKEVLLERYSEELSQVASDSTSYCSFPVSADELRNLSRDVLDDFRTFVSFHVPNAEMRRRLLQYYSEAELKKLNDNMMTMMSETCTHRDTLKKIENLGK